MDNRITDITDPSIIVPADDCSNLYFKLFNHMYDGLSVFELCGKKVRALYLNERYFDNVGYTKEQYRPYFDNITVTLLEEDEQKIFENADKCFVGGSTDFYCEVRGYRHDGSLGWFCVKARPVDFIKSDNPVFLATIVDISARKELQQQLSINSERYKILKETVSALLFEYKPFADRMTFSAGSEGDDYAVENYTEYLRKTNRLHPLDVNYYFNTLCKACRKSAKGFIDVRSYYSPIGGYGHYRVYYSSIADDYGSIISVVGRIEPISEERGTQPVIAESRPESERFGLADAQSGMEHIEEKIRAGTGTGYLVLADIDELAEINEKYGEEAGNAAIRTAAAMLPEIFIDSVIFRYYGDEFVIYMENITETQLYEMFEKLQLAAQNAVISDKNDGIGFSFSAGAAFTKNSPEKNVQIKDYFITADKALFKAKRDGRHRMYAEKIIF